MNKILFIDTLATGVHLERCAIYRIGGILCTENVNEIKEVRRFDFAVRPFSGARIAENSLWIGGVTRSTLAGYPPQEAAFADFYKLLEDAVKAAQDVGFLSANDRIVISAGLPLNQTGNTNMIKVETVC